MEHAEAANPQSIPIGVNNEFRRYISAISRLRVSLADFTDLLDFHQEVCRALYARGVSKDKLREYTDDAAIWAEFIAELLAKRPHRNGSAAQ